MTRLRVLVAVARHGSVTAAARALRYAQPSVSHHLARLEAETGSQLVQRVGRGIRLTEAGLVLAERAEEILGRLDAAEAELAAYTGLRAGRVRLVAFPSALGTFVPAAAAAFAADHPGVELRLTEAEPPDAIRLLRAGEADVALLFAYRDLPTRGEHPKASPGDRTPVTPAPTPTPAPAPTPSASASATAASATATLPWPTRPTRDERLSPDPTWIEPEDDGLRRMALLTESIYLVTPAGLAGDRLTDHRARRWIAGCERCRTALLSSCAAAGFNPDIAFTTDDYLAVQALVAAGLGVTTLPGLALQAHRHPDVRATPLPGLTRAVSAAVHGEPPDPPVTAALLAHLKAAAATWTSSATAKD
ncbi:LysR family transcriptional regulator [Pseudofrankia asymbiotica]|uniref:LysR family transcriptional regulator n=1 Tax=Pseudofrankia asymbiotica TaxID=1834516 RepID=A0A1V2I4I9_9ACTN|nr:LysR family transcriptional regulator [Pseudofrankia asymbiotica]